MSDFFDNPERAKQLFEDIAKLKHRKAEMEADLKKKEAVALAFMKKKNVNKIESEYGSFSPVTRSWYSHTENVTNMEDEIKKLKKEEIEKGLAKVKSTSVSLRFTSIKE